MVPGGALVENIADGDKYIHVSYILEFDMSSKIYKPTYRISFEDLDIETYPFRVFISMLEGKCGTLKITERYTDSQLDSTFNVKHLGFGFPVNPSGPIRILDRSTGSTLFVLEPMYCTCVKEITKVRNWPDEETICTSQYIFSQVSHCVNDVDQYKCESRVEFIPDVES